MAAPTEEEMQKWDEAVAEANVAKERQTRATMPELKRVKKPSRTATLMGVAIDPNAQAPQLHGPPTIREKRAASYQVTRGVGSIPPPKPLAPREPDAGRYQVVLGSTTQRPPRKA